MVKNAKKLQNTVYDVPDKVDKAVAEMKLKSLNVKIDKLTPEQDKYLNSWELGT